MEMSYELQFPQSFQDEYLRNNKANGSKNIRCFPCCTSTGHSFKGFCGQAVQARLIIRLPDHGPDSPPLISQVNPFDLTIVGEFQPLDEDYDPIDSGAAESALLSQSMAHNAKYARASVSSVQQTDGRTLCIALRFESRPWFYAWRGNRNKQQTAHAFVVTVFKSSPAHPSALLRLSRHHSSQFRIACLRRAGRKGPPVSLSGADSPPPLPLSSFSVPEKRPKRARAAARQREEEDWGGGSDSDSEFDHRRENGERGEKKGKGRERGKKKGGRNLNLGLLSGAEEEEERGEMLDIFSPKHFHAEPPLSLPHLSPICPLSPLSLPFPPPRDKREERRGAGRSLQELHAAALCALLFTRRGVGGWSREGEESGEEGEGGWERKGRGNESRGEVMIVLPKREEGEEDRGARLL